MGRFSFLLLQIVLLSRDCYSGWESDAEYDMFCIFSEIMSVMMMMKPNKQHQHKDA